jgi:hypothetical protein
MKKLALLAVLAGGFFLTGCDAPGYTFAERTQIIERNWGWEYSQIWDDVDEILLLRPADHLSQWDIQ